jgi:hypothetical protein
MHHILELPRLVALPAPAQIVNSGATAVYDVEFG